MNDYPKKHPELESDPEVSEFAALLEDTSAHITPDPAFTARLEQRLAASHSHLEVSPMFSLKKLAPAFVWVIAALITVFVIEWAIRSLVPQPVPAAQNTPSSTMQAPAPPVDAATPVPSQPTYDWHGTTLTLATSLPASVSEADVYQAQAAQHASLDDALALAQRFGIQGRDYQQPGELPGTTDYMVTDGRQSLHVRSAGYYTYTADMIKSFNNFSAITNPNANSIIGDFLAAHGFLFPHHIEWSAYRSAYVVEPLSADGSPLAYDSNSSPMLLVTLDEAGAVSSLRASLLTVADAPVRPYDILTADEALQKFLDPNTVDGVLESVHGVTSPIKQWSRSYPVNQALTIYGNVTSSPSAQLDLPAFIQIDGFPVEGQVSGLDKFSQLTYVEAAGQFVLENGIEYFKVDSWKVSPVTEQGLTGTLQRQGGQVTLTSQESGTFTLVDVPDDVPMPFENAYVVGTSVGDTLQWKTIDDRLASGGGGGGGGGGGAGFHKLHLTGTPVPFLTPTPLPASSSTSAGAGTQYTVQDGDTLSGIASSNGTTVTALMQANSLTDPGTLAVGQTLVIPASTSRRIDALRGMLSITINKHPDGSQPVAYGFIANAGSDPSGYMLLEGNGLEALQAHNSLPVDVWGSLDTPYGSSIPTLKVERFEFPFPDLKVQVFEGTQKLAQISGQPVTLFTTSDGKTYVQLSVDGIAVPSLIGIEGDQVQVEAVAIPGEIVGGYPALRFFAASLAVDPKTGLHTVLPITADRPSVIEVPDIGKPPELPTATVEKIELVHFLSDPRFAVATPGDGPLFFQPVWRFTGHYSNGDEFEVLVQALRSQFLLPELEPALQAG